MTGPEPHEEYLGGYDDPDATVTLRRTSGADSTVAAGGEPPLAAPVGQRRGERARLADAGAVDQTVELPAFTLDDTTVISAIPPDATVVLPVFPQLDLVTTGDQLDSSVARNSANMAIGSLVSRGTGFLRTVMLGAALGSRAVFDGYNISNTLPNMVYELLLGGVLASVVIPLLIRARRRDSDLGVAYAQRLLTLATVFLAAATVLAVALAPVLAQLMSPANSTSSYRHLVTDWNYLLLPEILFYGLAALISAILNTRGHFAAPMWTPILNNIVVIITAGTFMALPAAAGSLTPDTISRLQIVVIGVGTTLGIVVQAAGLLPALRRVGFRWRWRFDWRALRLRELGRVSGWMLGYVVISQVGIVVVLKLATAAGNAGGAGAGIYNNAYLIFMMAHGIVAVSIITALMPRMATAAAEQRTSDLAGYLSLGIRLSAVILVPVTAVYLVLGRQLGVALFAYRSYSEHAGVQTGWVIAFAGLGLVPFAISQLQIFAFYAMPDTRTPALVNIPVVVLRIGIDLLAYYVILSATWLAAGLQVGNAISYVFGAALGFLLLRRRVGSLGMRQVAGTLGRLFAAAVPGAVLALGAVVLVQRWLPADRVGNAVELVVGAVVLVAGYLAVAVMLRVREVTMVWAMVRGRLGR